MNKIIISVILGLLIFSSCNQNKKMDDKAVYSGDDISGNAMIIKDADSKTTSLEIKTNGKWKIYSGDAVDNIDFTTPAAEGNGNGTYELNVPFNARNYFQLETEKGKAILAERHLPMEGGYNFRDLGGIRNKDGKYVKWGKVFRGDELSTLTENDKEYLSSIPIISVVDFRSQEEINAAPDRNPSSVRNNYQYMVSPGNMMVATQIDVNSITESQVDSMMMNLNKLLVTDPASINRYREYFALLQNENDIPLLFHCTAGKDRTGMAAALFLYSLGVDDNTIMDDYLASNKYLERKYGQYKSQFPAIKALFEVKPEFLQTGIDAMKSEYGSIENYLTDVLNVDLDKMKNMYLY